MTGAAENPLDAASFSRTLPPAQPSLVNRIGTLAPAAKGHTHSRDARGSERCDDVSRTCLDLPLPVRVRDTRSARLRPARVEEVAAGPDLAPRPLSDTTQPGSSLLFLTGIITLITGGYLSLRRSFGRTGANRLS